MLQIFNYNNNNVTFRKEGNVVFVNATEMAKPFNKQSGDYLRLSSTQEFIQAYINEYSVTGNPVSVVKGGIEQGTWLQEDIALDFAQWLSPVFRVWCNKMLKQLLTTGTASIQSPEEKIAEGYRLAMAKVEQLEESNKLLTATVKEQAPKVEYVNQVLQSDGLINPSNLAQEFGLTAIAFHKKLKDMGIMYKCGGQWLFTAKYNNGEYGKPKTFPYLDTVGNQQTSTRTCFTEKGRQLLHTLLKKQKAA